MAKTPRERKIAEAKLPKEKFKYGIAEWLGDSIVSMPIEKRHELADEMLREGRRTPNHPCPFQSYGGRVVKCSKKGGVCSTRLYRLNTTTGNGEIVGQEKGVIRALCPNRFLEQGIIFGWIGHTVLGHRAPLVVSQVPYLQRAFSSIGNVPDNVDEEDFKDVGRIDHVLVNPETKDWCALEIQAVYFSGQSMNDEFRALRQNSSPEIPFPKTQRRPDDRSSGPKRLLPQLQTKVPALRRWGKKMAVVIDEGFFASLGKMREVPHISNSDILWFVVRFDESTGKPRLIAGQLHKTRLEDAIEGLTGGEPVSREEFEQRIQDKLARVSDH